jgi:sugar lactone lactonase YvrE
VSLLRPLLRGGHFFESPRWHEGRWWVSDMYGSSVLAVTPDGAAERVAEVEGQLSGLGWLADGTLLVVSMTNRAILAGGVPASVCAEAGRWW